jgi:hypothetical protein
MHRAQQIHPIACPWWVEKYTLTIALIFTFTYTQYDRLCGLVVRVPDYRSRGPGFDSLRYHIFWEVVGLERGPLSLVSTIEELLGRNSSGFGLENWEYGCGDPLRWPLDTLYPQKLALTSPTWGGCSVGLVRLRTKTTQYVCVCLFVFVYIHSMYGKALWSWKDWSRDFDRFTHFELP